MLEVRFIHNSIIDSYQLAYSCRKKKDKTHLECFDSDNCVSTRKYNEQILLNHHDMFVSQQSNDNSKYDGIIITELRIDNNVLFQQSFCLIGIKIHSCKQISRRKRS